MISITVHHHNPHLAAIATANGCATNNKQTSSSISSPAATTTSTTASSSSSSSPISPSLARNVEIQYKARFFHENEQEHSRQTITLKQVSNNGSNQSTETTDMNNNNVSISSNNNLSSLNDGATPRRDILSKELCDDERPINLHSRSISLVINPPQQQQRQQQQQDHSLQRLSRRRSMPRLARRTRLRLATEATCTQLQKQQQQQQPSDESESNLDLQPIETQSGELNSTKQEEQQRQTEGESIGYPESEIKDDDDQVKGTDYLAEIAQAEFKAQSLERLRQTGKFLREISDEFAK